MCLMIYILKHRVQEHLVWNNAPTQIRKPPHNRRLSLKLEGQVNRIKLKLGRKL